MEEKNLIQHNNIQHRCDWS